MSLTIYRTSDDYKTMIFASMYVLFYLAVFAVQIAADYLATNHIKSPQNEQTKICVFMNLRLHTWTFLYLVARSHSFNFLEIKFMTFDVWQAQHHGTMQTAWREQHNLGNKSGIFEKLAGRFGMYHWFFPRQFSYSRFISGCLCICVYISLLNHLFSSQFHFSHSRWFFNFQSALPRLLFICVKALCKPSFSLSKLKWMKVWDDGENCTESAAAAHQTING